MVYNFKLVSRVLHDPLSNFDHNFFLLLNLREVYVYILKIKQKPVYIADSLVLTADFLLRFLSILNEKSFYSVLSMFICLLSCFWCVWSLLDSDMCPLFVFFSCVWLVCVFLCVYSECVSCKCVFGLCIGLVHGVI